MNKRVLICVLVTLVVMPSLADAQKKNSISGRVLNSDGKPIPGVRVQLYRNSRAVGKPDPMLTDSDGKYSIDFDEGEPIDTVRYDQEDYAPATVEGLSGQREHIINKTLSKAMKMTYFQIHEALCAFETIYELDKRNEAVQRNFEIYKYRQVLSEIDSEIDALAAPSVLKNELKRQIALIKQKYGIQ